MTDSVLALATVPGVIAVVNYLRQLGLSARLAPLAALIVGVALQVVIAPELPLTERILSGVVLALGASGVWDVAHEGSSARRALPKEGE